MAFIGFRLIGLKPGIGHAALCFRILHERVPDESGSGVLSHQHSYTSVDSDYIGVIPTCQGIEGIDKSILAPGAWVAVMDGAQDPHRGAGQERERATGGCRHDCSVDGSHGRRTTPDDVPVLGV